MALNPRQMLGLANTRPSLQYQQLNQAYQSDPRRMLGQTLMGQGASAAPVRTPLQGLGRLSSALVGAYLQRKAGDAQVERETAMTDQIMGMLPENASPQVSQFASAYPTAFAQAAGSALLAPTSSQRIVNQGDLAYVQTDTNNPLSGRTTQSMGNLVQRRAAPKTFRDMTASEVAQRGLPTNQGQAYQLGSDGSIKTIGGGGININTGDKKGGEAIVSSLTTLSEKATSSRETMTRVDQMIGLLDGGVQTGFGEETFTGLRKLGQVFNPDYKVKEVAGAEAFTANANAMIGPLVKQLGSNPTDKDLGFFVTASPTLGKSVAGNKLLLKGIKLSQARQIALSEAAQNFIQLDENKGIGAEGLQGYVKLQKHLTNFVKTSPLFQQGGQLLIDEYTQLTGSPPPSASGSALDDLINQGLVAN